jgi:hypothetical protein
MIKHFNMKQLLFSTILTFVLCISTHGAFAVGGNGERVNLRGTLFAHIYNYEGSPYLLNDWKQGKIELENGQTAYGINVKYSILTGDIVFFNDTLKRQFTVDNETVKSFTIYDRPDSLYFEKHTGDDLGYRLKNSDFVQILYNDNTKLMVKHTVDILAANELKAKDKIVHRKRYFIQGSGKLSEIKPTLRSVIQQYPEQKKELRKILAEHDLKNKSIADIVFLMGYVNR